jgi:uncharacterized protein YbaA (DUF1428 family)
MIKQIKLDTSKIEYYLSRGQWHKDWYTYEANKLHELLPEFNGLPIVRCFAVTSMTTSIEANVHLAIKALLQIKRGECFHGFLPTQKQYLEKIQQGHDVPGRKIMSFIRALEGDKNAVVVDIWMCKAFGVLESRRLGPDRKYYKSPSRKVYEAIENYCIAEAHRLGIEPRQYQSIVWAAIKSELGMTRNVSWSDLLIKKKGMFPFID